MLFLLTGRTSLHWLPTASLAVNKNVLADFLFRQQALLTEEGKTGVEASSEMFFL